MKALTAARILLLLFGLGEVALASSGITYHGRLLNPDGTPVISSNVQFRMQIRTPGTEDCLMYEEIQTHNLSTTSGMFSISLGDGNGVRQDSYAWNLFDTLSNRKSFSFTPSDCIGVNSYVPAAADNRDFRIYFNDGTFAPGTWEALPVQTINYIPMSIESYAVGGFPASSLLRVETAGTLGVTSPLTATQYNEILALVAGTSSLYEKDGELNGSALPTIAANESVRWTGAAWQAFTPLTSETDPTVEAFAKASLPTCAVGEVLKSDGTSLSCVTDAGGWSAVDATTTVKGIVNVPSAGGLEVTSGAIGLPDVVTGGTYTKVTVDAKGRVTTGADITGSDITSGTIGGSTSISTTGTISAASMSVRQVDLYDSDNTHHISFLTPATTDLVADYDLVFPATLGSSNQVLGMNNAGTALENKSIAAGTGVTITHTANQIEIAATGSGGTVTSVSGTSPISVATGTTTPVISLDDAGTAGTYGSATQVPVFTTDAKGRVTAVTNTTIAGVSPVGSTLSTGQAWVGDGTNLAQARFIGINDLKTSLAGNATQIPTTCTASQTMTYSAVTDVFSCANISITASQVSDLSTELADYVEIAGDTMTGALNLPSNGLVVGTNQLVVSGGRVGIGTATPNQSLDVNGTVRAEWGIELGHLGGQVWAVDAPTTGDDGGILTLQAGNALAGGTNQYGGDVYIRSGKSTGSGESHIIFETSSKSGSGTTLNSVVERMRINSFGNVGIGTTDPSTKLDVAGTIQIANGGEACSAAADGGMIRYNGGNLQFCNESSWQTLGVSGAGLTSLNGQTGSTQTFATPGTTGTAPNWSSATNAHTLNIPMASTASVTAGLISKTDYDSFNTKQTSTLADGSVLIGNASNVATARTISGDATISNTGVLTLKNTGTAGTYGSANEVAVITTDAQGRVTAVTNTAITYTETDPKMQTLTTAEVDQLENIGATAISAAQWGYLGGLSAAPVTSNTAFIQDGNSFTGAATLGTNDANALNFETSGSPRMTILAGGNVGVGTASPSTLLHVKSGSETGGGVNGSTSIGAGLAIESAPDGASKTDAYINFFSKDSATDNQDRYGSARIRSGWELASSSTWTESYIGFQTHHSSTSTWNDSMIIRGGNVGIGTTDPASPLEVSGVIHTTTGGIKFPDGTIQTTSAVGGGTNNTMVANWPDAIRCTSSTRGETTLYIENAPHISDGKYYYVEPHSSQASNIYLNYNSDGTYNTGSGMGTLSNCNADISTIYSQGRGFNFAKGPAAQWLQSGSDAYYNAGNVGIGTATPNASALLDVFSTTKGVLIPRMTAAQRDAIATPAAGLQVYNTDSNALNYYDGDSWEAIGAGSSGITSLGGLTAATQTFAIGTSGLAPAFSSSTSTHTLNIPMASTASVTAGLISKADYDTFNAKLDAIAGSTLNSGQIFVGSAGNVAAAVGVTGDVTLSNTGATETVAIRGVAVDTSDPTATGQVLKYNITGTEYAAGFIGLNDMRSTVTPTNNLFPSTCTASQTLVHSAVTDTFVCTAITYTETDPKMQTLTTAEVNQLEEIGATTISAAQWGYLGGMSSAPLTGANAFMQGGNSFGAAATLGTNDVNALNFETGGTTKMSILSSGNVGVGTTGPMAQTEVYGAGQTTAALADGGNIGGTLALNSSGVIAGNGGAIVFGNSQSKTAGSLGMAAIKGLLANGSGNTIGDLAFSTRALTTDTAMTERVRITYAGNVGIGTTDPNYPLDIVGNARTSGELISTNVNQARFVFGNYGVIHRNDGSNYYVLLTDSADQYGTWNTLRPFRINNATGDVYFANGKVVAKHDGNVGIGTAIPASTLEVNGAARNTAAIANATAIVNFSTGNIQYTTSNCANFSLHNLKDGGAYTFIVQGTTVTTCSFSAYADAGTTPLTVHMPPDHGSTASGTHSLYSIIVAGTHAYFSWVRGY